MRPDQGLDCRKANTHQSVLSCPPFVPQWRYTWHVRSCVLRTTRLGRVRNLNSISKTGCACRLMRSARRWWCVAIKKCPDRRWLPIMCFVTFEQSTTTPARRAIWQNVRPWRLNGLKINGRIIYDLKDWRQKIDGLLNPIHLSIRKNGWSFDFPILQLHHEILAPLRPLSKEWVFPSPKSETGHITRPERLKYNPHIHR